MNGQIPVRLNLRVVDEHTVGWLVPSVLMDLSFYLHRARSPVGLGYRPNLLPLVFIVGPHGSHGSVQGIGCEIRPAIRSVAPEGAPRHQAFEVKYFLSMGDLVGGNHRFLG